MAKPRPVDREAQAADATPPQTADAAPARAGNAALPAGKRARRRQAILDAALAVFAEEGYANARLDEIAARAGVAKGTLYLYFRDKEGLFEELLRSAAAPVLARIARIAADPRLRADELLSRLYTTFRTEIVETDRRHIFRLLLTEGPRFPALTQFYHREIIARAEPVLREVLRRAHQRGEIASAGLQDYPQLVMAPALVAVMWGELFGRIQPLDAAGMFDTYVRLLTGKGNGTGGNAGSGGK